MRDPLLRVRDLRTYFDLRRGIFGRAGVVRAVDGVSFEIGRGEAVAVVGESGCGKSTLAKTLLGLHRPAGGEVVFEGAALHGFTGGEMRRYRRRVGYIQQDPFGALAPFMTVRRILEEPLRVNGVRGRRERAARVRAALEEVRLVPVEEFLPKFPHQLSGGQQQRVVIARAVILQPALLVADEPVSMLDASVRIGVLEILRGLQRAHGIGVLYITHDLSTVRHFSDRVLVMYAGKIVEEARGGDLIHEPLHPYTRALLAAIPDPDPSRAAVLGDVPPGEPPNLAQPPPGCRFHPRCPAFMKGTCDAGDVPETSPRPGRRVACWLHAPAGPG